MELQVPRGGVNQCGAERSRNRVEQAREVVPCGAVEVESHEVFSARQGWRKSSAAAMAFP